MEKIIVIDLSNFSKEDLEKTFNSLTKGKDISKLEKGELMKYIELAYKEPDH
jgi:hypothetical protein